VLKSVAASKLFYTLLIGQACLGTLVPLLLLGSMQLIRRKVGELNRRRVYFSSTALILMGVLAMRWNVVIGGQLFSKSLRGFMSYKMEFAGHEGWWLSLLLLALPFIILMVFIKYFLDRDLPTIENVVPGAVRHPNSPEAQI
jgi:predicted membrane protein